MTQAANFSHYITGYIQDGKIYVQSYEGTQQVGVTYQAHTELEKERDYLLETCETYKKRLIELGEIEVPPTQEEIIQQQAAELRETRALLERVSLTLDALTSAQPTTNEEEADNVQSRRTIPAGSGKKS